MHVFTYIHKGQYTIYNDINKDLNLHDHNLARHLHVHNLARHPQSEQKEYVSSYWMLNVKSKDIFEGNRRKYICKADERKGQVTHSHDQRQHVFLQNGDIFSHVWYVGVVPV